MNKVILSGRIKFDVDVKTSKGGKTYVKNKLVVDRVNSQATDDIEFMVFGDNALLLSHATKGSTVELSGEWRVNFNKEKKIVENYLIVREVQVQEIYEDTEDDEVIDTGELPDDDLPF